MRNRCRVCTRMRTRPGVISTRKLVISQLLRISGSKTFVPGRRGARRVRRRRAPRGRKRSRARLAPGAPPRTTRPSAKWTLSAESQHPSQPTERETGRCFTSERGVIKGSNAVVKGSNLEGAFEQCDRALRLLPALSDEERKVDERRERRLVRRRAVRGTPMKWPAGGRHYPAEHRLWALEHRLWAIAMDLKKKSEDFFLNISGFLFAGDIRRGFIT